ncbi:Fatty acid metabolism regulator protein [compost metagenome]
MTSRKQEKFEMILDAAEKVIAENGYHGSQVSKIAKEAGVADGTIYLYFKSKEDILISLFENRLGRLVSQFNESIQASGSPEEALRSVCEIHFTELEQNIDLAYVTQIELRQSSLELRKAIGLSLKPYIVLIEHILQKGVSEGVFRSNLDTKLTRQLIFGAMDEVVTSWLISGRKYSLSSQVDHTVDFFLRGLK